MKTKIRNSVFETNSSSTHSLVIPSPKITEEKKFIFPENTFKATGVHIEKHEPVMSIADTSKKFQYLITCLVGEGMNLEYHRLYRYLEMLEKIITKYTNCNLILPEDIEDLGSLPYNVREDGQLDQIFYDEYSLYTYLFDSRSSFSVYLL